MHAQRAEQASGGEDSGLTAGVFAFTFLAGLGTPLLMFVYLLLSIAGTMQARRTGKLGFQIVAVLTGMGGALAVFGGLYYSFVPSTPGTPIPLVTAMVPWLCTGVAVTGLLVAAWIRYTRATAWADMGTVFDEV